MSGKLFISLLCAVGFLALGVERAALGPHDWQQWLWIALGGFWAVRAFLYWRDAHAQGS